MKTIQRINPATAPRPYLAVLVLAILGLIVLTLLLMLLKAGTETRAPAPEDKPFYAADYRGADTR